MDAFVGSILSVVFSFPPGNWMLCNGQLVQIRQYQSLFSLLGTRYGGDGVSTFGLPDMRGRTPVGACLGAPASQPGLPTLFPGQLTGANSVTATATGQAQLPALTSNQLIEHSHTVTIVGSDFSASSILNATSQNAGQQLPQNGAALCSTAGVSGAAQAAIYQTSAPASGTMVPLSSASVTTVMGGNVTLTSSSTGGVTLPGPVASVTTITPPTAQVTTSSTLTSTMQPYLGLNYIICCIGNYPANPANGS